MFEASYVVLTIHRMYLLHLAATNDDLCALLHLSNTFSWRIFTSSNASLSFSHSLSHTNTHTLFFFLSHHIFSLYLSHSHYYFPSSLIHFYYLSLNILSLPSCFMLSFSTLSFSFSLTLILHSVIHNRFQVNLIEFRYFLFTYDHNLNMGVFFETVFSPSLYDFEV